MIYDISPVNIYEGNSNATTFDFDFYIENYTQLKVTLYDENSTKTILQYNIDYSINEFKNEEGSYITFPIEGSNYSVLNENQKISLELILPISQETQYNNSSLLNLKTLEYSFDYLTRLIQILARKNELCFKIDEFSDIEPNELINSIVQKAATTEQNAQNTLNYYNLILEKYNEILSLVNNLPSVTDDTDGTDTQAITTIQNQITSIQAQITSVQTQITTTQNQTQSALDEKCNLSLSNAANTQTKAIDGQFVALNKISLTSFHTIGTYDFTADVSNVLPNDNYNYELYGSIECLRSDTGSPATIDVFTKDANNNLINDVKVYLPPATASGIDVRGYNSVCLPFFRNGTAGCSLSGSNIDAARFYLYSYRRIGLNI